MNRYRTSLHIISLIILVGCAGNTTDVDRYAADIARVEQRTDADKLFIVDCLLPSQIRRLGSKMTYLSTRRALKTSALECESRGGEYVAYDRANYTSALQTWLPSAQQGDVEAQTYVGEIYAKGQGTAPNYPAAAEWYAKAAAQGDKRAQINLGYLYEKGLGVVQNLTTAMQWYQKASGLEQAQLPYATTLNTASTDQRDELREEIKLLKTALQHSRDEAKTLTEQLQDKQQQLQQSLAAVQQSRHDQAQTQAQLNAAQAQGNKQEQARLEKVLQDNAQALTTQQQKTSELEAQYQQQVAALNQQLEATEKRAKQLTTQLQSQQTEGSAAQLKLLAMQARLANTEKQLLTAQQQATAAQASSASTAQTEQALQHMQQQLEASETARQKSQTLINELTAQKRQYETQIQQLQQATKDSTLTISQKPVIEIIDPPFVLVRGKPTVTLRAIVKERDIIGKVTAPAGVLSVLVNDVKNTPDVKGIFKTAVSLSGDTTPVNVVAIDNNGLRESLEFLVALDKGAVGGARGEDSSMPNSAPWRELDFGNYYALIIGNNHYQKVPSLDTPANDARAIDQLLSSKYGFKTKLLLDANRYQILSAMNELRAKLTDKDNLLIYYAGHGELDEVNMRGHWLPVDADADNNANWISTTSITDILNAMSSKHILIVADSCYSGAMTRASLARLDVGMNSEQKSEWLKAMLKAKSRTALTSGGLKPVMDGGGGSHSVFANAFIKALQNNTGLLEGQELYRHVSANVVAIAANYEVEQVPQYAPVAHAGHEAGEFFFIPR